MGRIRNFLASTPVAGVEPRKAGKTTSYTSGGMPGVAQPDMSPESGSSQPSVIRELVPELISPVTRRIAYATMLNDAGVDVSVRAIKTPVLGAEFFMEPHSDDPNDVLISQFVWDNLAGGMSSPFISVIEDILRFFEDGYSVLEKVYELRSWSPSAAGANSKNYTMLKKLGIRPESTISQVDYDDNGGTVQIIQQAIQADKSIKETPIAISKLLVFTFNRRGGNIQGKSILRTAYPHWYYKNHLYKIDAIQKQRHGVGIPKGQLLPGFNPKDKQILRDLLRNIATNEEGFVLLTPNVDITMLELQGQPVNVLESVEHHAMMIMLNVMAQFLTVASSSGARANAATQADMFMKALRYIANYIADIINMYLIPELVVWNFPTTNFPKLRVKNLGETKDLQMLAAAFGNLLSQGGVTNTLATENFFRKVFDMPAISQQEFDAAQATVAAGVAADNTPPADSSSNGNGKGGIKKNGIKPGNVGKSPSSAASAELLENVDPDHLELLWRAEPVPTPEQNIEVNLPASEHTHNVTATAPVEVSNEYTFELPEQPAPQINVHLANGDKKPLKLKSSIVTKLDGGKTLIEYNYDEEGEEV